MSLTPKEEGMPIRYPSTALLCVDTYDTRIYDREGYRLDSRNPADIKVNNQRPLLFGYMTRLALTEVNLQWSIPNVNPNNNTITIETITIPGAVTDSAQVSIPVGWYQPTELVNALQTALNAEFAPLAFSVTLDPKSFQITIEADNSGSNDFLFTIVSRRVGNTIGTTYYPPLQDDLTDMLGLTPVASFQGTPYGSIVGGFASFQYTPYVDIVSNILTKNQNVQDGDSQKTYTTAKLARIYFANESIAPVTESNIPGVRPFVLRREFRYPKQIQWNTTENVDLIDLQVLDHKGYVLYNSPTEITGTSGSTNYEIQIGNTADFQFTIQATEV